MGYHRGNVINEILNEIHDHSLTPPTINTLIYGFDGTNKQILKTDTSGRPVISPVTIFAVVNTGASSSNVTLNPSPNFIGIVTVANPSSFSGNVTLNPGPNQIGSVTIANNPTLGAGANYIGLASVNIGGTIPALSAGTNFIGLASVQGNVNATQAGTWNMGVTGLLSLASGTEVRTRAVSNVTLNSSDAFIGLATVVQANQPSLVAGSAYIGLASVNIGGTLPPLSSGTNFIGLASIQGNVNATQSGAWNVGVNSNVTIVPTYLSTYTSLSTVVSASGLSTIFAPPSNQRWILKDLIVGSQGSTLVSIRSNNNDMIPAISLATQGGFISNFGDSGLRAKATNDLFSVNLGSAATISVTAVVRFE